MAKVYVTKCVVRKDKKQYPKGAVIEGLTAAEIERGLAQHWLEAVGTTEEPVAVEDRSKKKGGKGAEKKDDDKSLTLPKTERDQLLEKAVDLGILDKITDETTTEEIQKLIEEAQAK